MADDVKQLLISVDASVALLRQNLMRGERAVAQFETANRATLDRLDRRFATVGRPLNGISATVARTRADVATIGNSVQRVERQVVASAGSMKAALLASASGVAAAFTAGSLKEFADGYTRFTNQLKVAGLEGEALGKTQENLYGIAQRYGVELEDLGGLYGRLSQGSKELGASQADLMRFVSGVGAGLKVQGAPMAASRGAIQQLTQALGGVNVRAEEFNSINEGARPVLQAVATGIDRFEGSVSKLRAEVVEGKVTSKEFFEGFLTGSAALEAQATKSTLTIGASFTILNNAIGRYIGQTDESLSVTERASAAIVGLANNLNVIAPALGTIAVAYGSVKAAGLAFGAVSGVIATVTATDRALAAQILQGNATYVSRTELAAASARATALADANALAGIETTIAARQAERVQIAEQIVAERALGAERRAQAALAAASNVAGAPRTAAIAAQRKAENDASFAAARLTAARQRQIAVDVELAAAEGMLAGAQTRAAASAGVATAATTAASFASRAAAASGKLFAGALTLIGGSVAGGAAVLAIGALVGAIMIYRSNMAEAEAANRATATSMAETAAAGQSLNRRLAELATISSGAASGIAQVGNTASSSTGKMLAFAGAVGEAASRLYDLARARRHEQTLRFATESVAAEKRANEAQARIDGRGRYAQQANAYGATGGVLSAADQRANADDARIVVANRAQQAREYRAAQQSAAIPLEQRVRETDRPGGRDSRGNIAQVSQDLTIARRTGNKPLVQSLEAKLFEERAYQRYREKDKLSPEAASAAASADAGRYRSATGEGNSRRETAAAGRASSKAATAAAAERRREAVAVRDSAADARAYSAAERQANNDIATARADLSGSAIERAQIEKARIEGERENRNGEIQDQSVQGRFGTGDQAKTRVLELQRLNNERAALETQVVDKREAQRGAEEALAIASATRAGEVELLQKQGELVTTAGERRDIELRVLAIQYEEERARLRAVSVANGATDAEAKIAAARLAALDRLQEADTQSVERQNAGPTDQYRQRLRAAAGDMGEALDGVAANGLQNMEDGLLGIITGTESVGSAFKKMAASILADLARIAIQKAIISAIGTSFMGFSGGGAIDGYAGGGSPGGMISGPGTGTSDSILAVLGGGRDPIKVSNKEFIVNAAATAANLPLIAAINAGRGKRFVPQGERAIGAIRGLKAYRAGGSPGMSGLAGMPSAGTPAIFEPRLPSPQALGAQRGSVQRVAVDTNVKVEPSPLLVATIQQTAVQTVGAAAEPIMAGAESRTMRSLNRPGLPGGLG